MKIGDKVKSTEDALIKFNKGTVKSVCDEVSGNVIVQLEIGGVENELSLMKDHVVLIQQYNVGEYVYTPRGLGKVTEYNEHADYYRVDLEDEKCNIMVEANDVSPGDLRQVFEGTSIVREQETIKTDPKQVTGSKKLNFNSVPLSLRAMAVKANDHGASKYGVWNWLKVNDNSMSYTTYLNAFERHCILLRAGQDYNSDALNVHHLDSLIAGLGVLREGLLLGKVKDDREKWTSAQIAILEKVLNNET